MANNYGYISSSKNAPTQDYKSNKGIFNVEDIYDLNSNDNWTNPGQMELIVRQEISSSVSEIEFTNIKENEYQNHVLYIKDVNITGLAYLYFSNDGGSSYASWYRYSNYYTVYNTGAGNENNNGATEIYFGGVGSPLHGIINMSNLGDGGKIASVTYHMVGPTVQKQGHAITGAGLSWNAFKIGATTMTTGVFALYGIKGNL